MTEVKPPGGSYEITLRQFCAPGATGAGKKNCFLYQPVARLAAYTSQS